MTFDRSLIGLAAFHAAVQRHKHRFKGEPSQPASQSQPREHAVLLQSRCATKRGPKRLFTLKSDRRRAAATRTARLAMRSLRAMVLCALALIVLVATSASAAVLGIDYGSEYLKVSIVAPGR